MRSRVGPATTVTGAATIWLATRWMATRESTVTRGETSFTGSATGARENDASASRITLRAAERSSSRPVEPGAIVM